MCRHFVCLAVPAIFRFNPLKSALNAESGEIRVQRPRRLLLLLLLVPGHPDARGLTGLALLVVSRQLGVSKRVRKFDSCRGCDAAQRALRCADRALTISGALRGKRISVAAVTLVVAAFLASAGLAFPPDGGTESGQLTLPPDGNGTAVTSTLPAKATQGTITADSSDSHFFDTVTAYLTAKPTYTARVVGCVKIYTGLVNPESAEDFTISEPTLQLLFLHVCIQMATVLSKPPGGSRSFSSAASLAAGACKTKSEAVPVGISRSGSGYKAIVHGKPYTPKSRSPLLISCRRSAGSLTLSLRPRSRAAHLAQIAGPNLGIGFSSTSNQSGRLRFSFTVK